MHMNSRNLTSIVRRIASGATSQARIKANVVNEKISRSPNGLTIASLDLGGAVSHLLVAFKAGTRYEMSDESGLVHQLRNCIGGDSKQYYGAQLIWQCGTAGANVASSTTRDLLSVQMSVGRSNVAIGLSLLGELAQPALKPWDVDEFSSTLDIDRAYLTPYDILMDNLHEAAFRGGPLGNSLFARKQSTGHYDYKVLERFAASRLVTGNAVIVGINVDHDHIVGYANNQFSLTEGTGSAPKPSPYFGGEGREKNTMNYAHVAIVGEGASLKDCKGLAVQAVLASVLGHSSATKHLLGAGQTIFAKSLQRASNGYPFGLSSISEVYEDAGLIGLYIVAEADRIGCLFDAAVKTFKDLKVDDAALQKYKRIATVKVLMRTESGQNIAMDRAAQIFANGKTENVGDFLKDIASVTADDLMKSVQRMKSKLTVSSYGNIYQIPYLDTL